MAEQNLDMAMEVEVVWIKPHEPRWMGYEAIELATAITNLRQQAYRMMARSVRAGFRQNFMQERSPEKGPWAQLRPRTKRERKELLESNAPGLVPGFGEANPILRRTGSYMRSWTQLGHRFHIERRKGAEGEALVGMEPWQIRSLDPAWNEVVIEVGSRDPRADALEEGLRPGVTEMMPGMAQAMEREGYDPDKPFLTPGNIAPRPVRYIAEGFARRIGMHAARHLTEHAVRVK